MRLRDSLVLEYLTRDYSPTKIAKELNVKPPIVYKIIKRMEKRGYLLVDRSCYPHAIRVLGLTPINGQSIQEGLKTGVGKGVKAALIWALRNFAVKFNFKGDAPRTWRKFKDGWRGGPAYIKYVRNSRVEAYMGKRGRARTLMIYAPRDMEGADARVLEHEAIEWCKRQAAYLADKLSWTISEQYALSGAVVPVKRGEFECRPLKPYAKKLRELGLTPIFHPHGKIDKSPKPAAFQIYTGEWAQRVWETPAILDKMADSFELYNQNIVKHLSVLDEMKDTLKAIRKDLKGRHELDSGEK